MKDKKMLNFILAGLTGVLFCLCGVLAVKNGIEFLFFLGGFLVGCFASQTASLIEELIMLERKGK